MTTSPAAGAPPVLERVREFFLLRDADARAKSTPDDVRTAVGRSLTMARQKRDAAETLWISGAPAEALRLAREAFELALSARASAPDALGTLDAHAHAKALALQGRLEGTELPTLDADVTDAHAARFTELVDAHDALSRRIEPIGWDSQAIARHRVQRLAAAAAALVVLIALLVLVLRTPRTLRTEASAAYADKYAAKMAVDGRTDTEWLLPDGTPGWLDVIPSPVRTIKALKLLNAKNVPFDDRATRDYKVEAFSKGVLAKTVEGTIAAFSETPEWVRVPLDVPACDRIRITVKSWHKSGGGFAEVEVE